MTVHSLVAHLHPHDIRADPFPHIVAQPALPPDYSEELADAFPSMVDIIGSARLKNNHAYRIAASSHEQIHLVPWIWREFLDYHCSTPYLRELLRLWDGALAQEYPAFERMAGKPASHLTAAPR